MSETKYTGLVFHADGVDKDELMMRLNHYAEELRSQRLEGQSWLASVRTSKTMAHLASAAMVYDQLCAGVNQSIGNAFKGEQED